MPLNVSVCGGSMSRGMYDQLFFGGGEVSFDEKTRVVVFYPKKGFSAGIFSFRREGRATSKQDRKRSADRAS